MRVWVGLAVALFVAATAPARAADDAGQNRKDKAPTTENAVNAPTSSWMSSPGCLKKIQTDKKQRLVCCLAIRQHVF